MKCNFHVGQRVAATCDFEHGFKEGDVATISEIRIGNYNAHDGFGEHVCLRFREARSRVDADGFDARYFRPVAERKTDISIFKSMLNPSRERADA